MRYGRILALFLIVPLLLTGCVTSEPFGDIESLLDPAPPAEPFPAPASSGATGTLKSMGYAAQVGAFARVDNAVRLEAELRRRGIDAYYFRHESGLYKVRFGDHPDYAAARREAESLHAQGLIDEFFIVRPEEYAAARIKQSRQGDLRQELVDTARRFLGVPYCWGGESAETGFDCSGLTMVAYRLNGLKLPRNSRWQFGAGRTVAQRDLQKGDLVFFATNGGRRVSHVGMYIGDGRFIHAPRKGKTVRVERMANSYFAKRYVGGRAYL